MRKHVIPLLLLAAVRCAFSAAPAAPEVPQKPWRPYPQVPELLWYEDFESDNKQLFEKGALKADVACSSGIQCAETVRADKDNVYIIIKLPPKLKFPGGINPDQIYIQTMVWSDESGDVVAKVSTAKNDYAYETHIPHEKTWSPVVFRLSEFHNKSAHPEAADVYTKLELRIKPRGGRVPTAYFDDVAVTAGAKPMDVLPKIILARKTVLDSTRTVAKDGFSFTPNDALKSEMKVASTKHKARTIVVLSPHPSVTEDLTKALAEIAPKIKAIGYNFVSASAPDESMVGGIDDMRTLLSYNLQKTEAETTLLVFGHDDALSKGRTSFILKALVSRSLANGTMPLVCTVPTQAGFSKDEKLKVDTFNNALINLCKDMNLPYVDTTAALKGNSAGLEKNDLNAAGAQSLATVAAEAIKHMDSHIFGRN